jgi:aryl-alcohol dehydrogenase-like predicted oxidoreductase
MEDGSSAIKRHPVLAGVEMGIGTWAWGDRLFWGFGKGYQESDLNEAFFASLELGLTFFDTAEVYGQGRSESILGALKKEAKVPVTIASKFMPYPWRLVRSSLKSALKNSLKRLDLQQLDLYQIHWPLPPVNIETWMDALVEVHQAGLVQAVGVSNYNLQQTNRAYEALARDGVPLASNQIEYNLLERKCEKSGLLKRCQELGVTVIAYSPLAQGVLSGKYTVDAPPQGFRARRYNRKLLSQIPPLISALRKIGNAHDGKTPAQVALNWVMCKGAVPIPGAKNGTQLEANAGALGWRLSEDEIALLDESSDKINAV